MLLCFKLNREQSEDFVVNGRKNKVKNTRKRVVFLFVFRSFTIHLSFLLLLLWFVYNVAKRKRETNQARREKRWMACSCSVVCCVGSEESEVRKRTLLSSLHTSQHSTKNKEWWCVVWERKKACFHYLSFFITIQHHSFPFLFPFFTAHYNEMKWKREWAERKRKGRCWLFTGDVVLLMVRFTLLSFTSFFCFTACFCSVLF